MPTEEPTATPSTILVVDDVPENLALLFDVLGGAGFNVLVAESGETALERMHELHPDLILLDVVMPGIDGFETCRRLKAETRWAETPVIFMTALSETVDKVTGFRAGAVDYVGKPVEADEVLARVRAHLQLRQLRRELEERNRSLAAEVDRRRAAERELEEQNEDLTREVERRRAAERQLEETLDQAVIVAEADGRIRFCTYHAWDLLGKYFGLSVGRTLPGEIQSWCGLRPISSVPFTRERPDGTLTVRLYSESESGGALILRLEEKLAIAGPEPLQKLGLTPREAEVLYWSTQGKTTPEIAIILEAAPNTVKKHLSNIFQKLGVETRTAAALRALEILGLPSNEN